jgi:hypothetical protein
MNKLIKSAIIGLATIGLTASAMTTTASADRFGHRHHGGGGALAAGLAIGVTGLILSEALRDRHRGRVYLYEDDGYGVSCRRLAYRCDDGSRRACREWYRYCD